MQRATSNLLWDIPYRIFHYDFLYVVYCLTALKKEINYELYMKYIHKIVSQHTSIIIPTSHYNGSTPKPSYIPPFTISTPGFSFPHIPPGTIDQPPAPITSLYDGSTPGGTFPLRSTNEKRSVTTGTSLSVCCKYKIH